MIFKPIASSSHGNAYLIADGESRILLECGIPFKRLQAALDYTVQDLDGCFITHEHKDHAGHVAQLIKRGVPVYATPGTVAALELEGITPLLMIPGNSLGAPVRVGSFIVVPFRVAHDAAEPVGYLIRDSQGEKLAFATDLVNIAYRLPGIHTLAIEANYDEEILSRNSHLPDAVVKRIRNSHMEIHRLCEYISDLNLNECETIWLLHLSDASSDEGRFVDLVERAAPQGVTVKAAPRG